MLKQCIRGFEAAQPYDTPASGVKLPQRATPHSAGYDFFALHEYTLSAGDLVAVATGVKAYMQAGEVLILANRSSNPRKGLILANGIGIVDRDYYGNESNDGHIMFLFKATKDVRITAGDKIGQGYFTTYLTADSGNGTTTRKGGFGSTDEEN